ncbi:MAG TPA: F0F1 ATP synthase subunit A [Candidatus Acidoferrales bacterium]|nr:F0F1 ATP synthase subunit A [Candidatus Acidoferrales bacterium]
MEHPFTWYSWLHVTGIPEQTFHTLIVMATLLVLAFFARRRLTEGRDRAVPEPGLGLANIFGFLVELVIGLSDGIIGKKGRRYASLFASFFIFILTANLFGLVPGFSPPTSNYNVTLSLGLISFVAYNYFGVREHGARYIKQFMGPVLLLAPFFLVLEAVSHLVRPVSLSLRLFGNIFGDHLVVEIFTHLTRVGVPVLFYALGALVSFIQAFVFTLLSVIYVAMAISHEH